MEYIAKTDGTKIITLEEHASHVIEEGDHIVNSHPFVLDRYQQQTDGDLAERVKQAATYHDEGKKDHRWQKAINKDLEARRKGEKGNNLLKVGLRHEIHSLIRCKDLNLSEPVKAAIAAHHGKLSFAHQHRWKENSEAEEVWSGFRKLGEKYRLRQFEEALLEQYEYSGVRSYLRLADHRASGKESGGQFPDFKSFSYDFPEAWNKRPVQNIAEEHWEDDLLLIRAPTGSGKTDAALLWAKKQIDNERADRLVIAMPTRFTSNALEVGITENLSNTGLYHSTAALSKYEIEGSRFKDSEKYKYSRLEFARLLETPVTVCTIDHLLMALTLTREDHHGIIFNLAHSCVVIDEADFYDDFTQANILVLLKALNILEVPVLIMSASLPSASLQMYKTTGFSPADIKEDESDYDRHRCFIKSFQEYEKIDQLGGLLQKCLKEPTIIYTNTVDKAMEFYKWFSKRRIKDVTVYHSRFTEPDKEQKERELIEKLGKEAWENGTAHGVAIMTQIGEMSVNISADLMLTDLCPIDRLVQRIGRLSRFSEQDPGEVHVLLPVKNDKLYPAPYGNYDMNKREWEPSEALFQTNELIKAKAYTASEFVDLVDEVYAGVQDFSPLAENNAKNLRESVVNNWLILPKQQTELDDTGTDFWRSRNIPPQTTIFTEHPGESFNSWIDFQIFKIKYGVDSANYLVKKGLENEIIFSNIIQIGDVKESIFYVIPGYYDSNVGLKLNEKRNTNSQIVD